MTGRSKMCNRETCWPCGVRAPTAWCSLPITTPARGPWKFWWEESASASSAAVSLVKIWFAANPRANPSAHFQLRVQALMLAPPELVSQNFVIGFFWRAHQKNSFGGFGDANAVGRLQVNSNLAVERHIGRFSLGPFHFDHRRVGHDHQAVAERVRADEL